MCQRLIKRITKTMKYEYFTCDVFTAEKFSGNQLAVFPHAQGLSENNMQDIAREFNFSETSFVFPPQRNGTRKVRIYTPTTEVPFAGHPNIGTAFILANSGALGELTKPIELTFEELSGDVPITVLRDDSGLIWCEISAPQALSFSNKAPVELVASVLSLDVSEIITKTHFPQEASVGLPFLFIEIASFKSLTDAQIDLIALKKLLDQGFVSYIHAYTKDVENYDIKARMFAPLDGVIEDPATGSANCALIALLSDCDPALDLRNEWRISQGTEVGRPSVLYGRTEKENGQVIRSFIGGHSVLVSEGILII
jgi:trans-2,3-dihydro-3-hydroxyanthranilate isomerase